MKECTTIGIDISKRIFHLVGISSNGLEIFKKKVYRDQLMIFMEQLPRVRVALEACGSSNYLGRCFKKLGFEVVLIAPQYVKPYVKTNKNDWSDAAGIAEAAQRRHMRFVTVKTIEQQELQHLHRARENALKTATMLNNSVRGMLLEYGIAIPLGKKGLLRAMEYLADPEQQIGELGRSVINQEIERYYQTIESIRCYDKKIEEIAKTHPVCKRLQTVPGVGPVIATALVASVGNPAQYKNGREFSASLGLVPKQHSTGGVAKLLGISKRGDRYIRKILVHGSRSILYRAHLKDDKFSQWATQLKARKGWNKTAVAVANKTARICWHILRFDKEYEVKKAAA